MRKKKKKSKKKTLLVIVIFLFFIYINYDFIFETCLTNKFDISNLLNHSDYKIIKQNQNKNYAGVGQKEAKNQDGYFTTFTTEEKHQKIYLEYKQNEPASWSNKSYWGGTMAENGCGITALAIILSGYQKNISPEDLRQKYYPVLNATEISRQLSSTFAIQNSDFYFDTTHLSNESIMQHLQTNRPILICVWNNVRQNRWTEKSHYMVLLATDGEQKVYVSNPNGGKNDSKSSGWYNIEEITPYLAKALYIESYE